MCKSHCGTNFATSQNEMHPETVSILSDMSLCQRINSSFEDNLECRKVVINSSIECIYYTSVQIKSSIHKTYAHYWTNNVSQKSVN